MLPAAIVFDLDGTLVLAPHDFRKMREAIARSALAHGARAGSVAVNEQIGTSQTFAAARRALQAANASTATLSQFEKEADALVDEVEVEALPKTTAREGAVPLLTALRARGVLLGVFTRSSDRFCREALRRTGLAEFFSHVRTRSAAGPAKPAPEALLLLVRVMGLPVERTLFIGDNLEDAACAEGAGVRFFGLLSDPKLPRPTTAEHFRRAGAEEVAANLTEVARLLGLAPRSGENAL
jgi:phosphoglycolate phosphatase